MAWFLDPAIEFPNPTGADEPRTAADQHRRLVGRPARRRRRRSRTSFLAADYVRTHTDLATMEGANEAARRAVNVILDATGSAAPRCEVFALSEPSILRHARRLDRMRWLLFHRPARPPLKVDRDGELRARGVLGRAGLALSSRGRA